MGFGQDRVGLLLFPLLISLAEGAFDFSLPLKLDATWAG